VVKPFLNENACFSPFLDEKAQNVYIKNVQFLPFFDKFPFILRKIQDGGQEGDLTGPHQRCNP